LELAAKEKEEREREEKEAMTITPAKIDALIGTLDKDQQGTLATMTKEKQHAFVMAPQNEQVRG
jgi:hypothetical protein